MILTDPDFIRLERRVSVLEKMLALRDLVGLDRLRLALEELTVVTDSETVLQSKVRERLQELRLAFREELKHGMNRFDFWVLDTVPGTGIAVELKTKGGLPDLLRQLDRYAEDPIVSEMLVVTTRRQHLKVPAELRGKRVSAIWVGAL